MPAIVELQRQYTRTDPRGRAPRMTGAPEIGCNRLAVTWRPIIDMTHTELAPISLRMIRPVSEWIADPTPGRLSWFSRIAVPGLRGQVLRHAGLDAYAALRPADLRAESRTPAWQRLVDALGEFAGLNPYTRALVVFQLAQLTFCHYAIKLTGIVPPTGERGQDQYAYEAARVHARVPGAAAAALPVFEALATGPTDPLLAYHACFQGIALALRSGVDVGLAQRFERIAEGLPAPPDDWEAHLTLGRFRRALVRLRMAQRSPDAVRAEVRAAWHHQEEMEARAPGDVNTRMLADENRRDLLELEIEAARSGVETPAERIRACAAEVVRIDPRAADGRLAAADGFAAAGDLAAAAVWYARAGELGTTNGSIGWFRAAQCYDRLGDHDSAVNAMGRCLELDTTAVEPRRYLAERN
jgi:hypothetical protein